MGSDSVGPTGPQRALRGGMAEAALAPVPAQAAGAPGAGGLRPALPCPCPHCYFSALRKR